MTYSHQARRAVFAIRAVVDEYGTAGITDMLRRGRMDAESLRRGLSELEEAGHIELTGSRRYRGEMKPTHVRVISLPEVSW